MGSLRKLFLCPCLVVWLLLRGEAHSAVPPPPAAAEHCESGLTLILQEVKALMTSTGICSSANKKQELALEALTSALQQQGQLVTSLVSQTETLQVAVKAVAELQEAQRQTMAQLRGQMEDDRQIRRNQRRTLEDMASEVHKVGKQGQARDENFRLLEGSVKSGLQKAEQETSEAATEMKEAQSRTQELAKVIRRVQKSLNSLETRFNLQSSNMVLVNRDNVVRRPKSPRSSSNNVNNRNTLSTTNTTTTTNLLPKKSAPVSPLECPHPFTKLGSNCYTVHSQERLTWKKARERCSAELSGDLANPDDMYELQLFLDESFPVTQYSATGGWGFWIGAKRESFAAENSWTWVSGLPVEIGLDFWGRGEPGDLEEGGSCLYVHSWWRFRGGSDPCEELKYFICEFKMETI